MRREKREKREEQKRVSEICKKKPEINEISIEKERGSIIYQRDCEREKEDLSRREFFTPIVSTLI